MKLSEQWMAFCKKHLDKWMLRFQRDPDVSLKEWNELQAEYNKTFGKKYETTFWR